MAQDSDNSSPSAVLMQVMSSYMLSQAVYVAAKLGIADVLAAGAADCDELARTRGRSAG